MIEEESGRSITSQVMAAWFSELEGSDLFDASTVENLKTLAAKGQLKKATAVAEAMKAIQDKADATP